MEKNRKIKVIILSTLIVGILTLTIAFSALSRALNIDGVGKMDTATWDVHFENLSDAKITRDAIEISKPNISLDKGTVENINVKLTKPKDEIKYVVDIVNKGTLDAEVNIMTISDLTDEQKKLIDFGVYYLNGNKITKYDLLEPEDLKNIVIKIRYKDDITEFELPSEPIKINLSCQIEYVQSNAEIVIKPNGDLENVTSILARGNFNSATGPFFNGELARNLVESITFLNTLKVPKAAKDTAWDASAYRDRSVVAWYTDIDNNGLYEVNIGGNGKVYASAYSDYLFWAFTNLKEINFNNNFDTTNVVSMYNMFTACTNLKSIDISSFSIPNATDLSFMFDNCSELEIINANMKNSYNVKKMEWMFASCKKLKHVDINDLNTSNVTDMKCLFRETAIENINISNWNTSNVTDMNCMFLNCKFLKEINISNWNTSNVTNMKQMFYYCESLEELNLNGWNTSKVISIQSMFGYCKAMTKIDLRTFETTSMTNMNNLFEQSKNLSIIYLNSASFDNAANYTNILSSLPNGFKIYVKDELAKDFVLSQRSDAIVTIEPINF